MKDRYRRAAYLLAIGVSLAGACRPDRFDAEATPQLFPLCSDVGSDNLKTQELLREFRVNILLPETGTPRRSLLSYYGGDITAYDDGFILSAQMGNEIYKARPDDHTQAEGPFARVTVVQRPITQASSDTFSPSYEVFHGQTVRFAAFPPSVYPLAQGITRPRSLMRRISVYFQNPRGGEESYLEHSFVLDERSQVRFNLDGSQIILFDAYGTEGGWIRRFIQQENIIKSVVGNHSGLFLPVMVVDVECARVSP